MSVLPSTDGDQGSGPVGPKTQGKEGRRRNRRNFRIKDSPVKPRNFFLLLPAINSVIQGPEDLHEVNP